MTAFDDALYRLGQYNASGDYNATSHRYSFLGRGGMDANYVQSLRDVATAAGGVGTLVGQAQQAVTDAQQAATNGAAAMQAIADGVAGALANTVPVSTQGRDLVAAATPAAACAVIGAATASDLASKAAADLSNAAALATIHSYALAL